MSNYSDLEEGEIPDSPSPSFSTKRKDLPKRYVVQDKGNHQKHKKRQCKYAIRYHAKKIAKKMKTPTKNKDYHKHKFKTYSHEKYKYTVPKYENSNDLVLKFLGSKTNCLNIQTEAPEIVNSLKGYSNDCNIEKFNISPISNIKNESDDDEEELRRIALASCSSRALNSENPCKDEFLDVSYVDPVPKLLDSVTVPVATYDENYTSDNYEVIDMEVDNDDIQSSIEINNENLFVIDTKPSSFQDDKCQMTETIHNENGESDDDFEADILRAELINSMLQKKLADEQADMEETCDLLQEPSVEKLDLEKSSKHSLQKHANKIGEFNNSTIHVPNHNITKSSKRFVISLKEESSSEESGEENAVASLEALISDARQKSDFSKNDASNVSCLSKAQQEEYNTLTKMLADKKQSSTEAFQQKDEHKKIVPPKSNDLKALEEKLTGFKENLKKEKELMDRLSNEVKSKWNKYVKSKLAAQLLKEKCIAAEKVRRQNLSVWSKSRFHYDAVTKSVFSLQGKITELENLYSKVGSNIQG